MSFSYRLETHVSRIAMYCAHFELVDDPQAHYVIPPVYLPLLEATFSWPDTNAFNTEAKKVLAKTVGTFTSCCAKMQAGCQVFVCVVKESFKAPISWDKVPHSALLNGCVSETGPKERRSTADSTRLDRSRLLSPNAGCDSSSAHLQRLCPRSYTASL